MSNSTISIYGNKIFSEILSEIKIFSKYKVKYYDNIESCINEAEKNNELVIFFISKATSVLLNKVKKKNFSLILIGKHSEL